MLHPIKNQAILQWFNSMYTNISIESLSQFADGSHFYDILQSIIPLKGSSQRTSPGGHKTETINDKPDKGTTVSTRNKKKESAGKDVPMDTSTTEASSAEDIAESDTETVIDENLGEKEAAEDIAQKRYDEIKKYIDSRFSIESINLINYSDCIRGKELELAKVAVLLLSAVIMNLSSDDQQVQTMTLLDVQVQEEIKECITTTLIYNPTEPVPENKVELRKTDLHRILSRPSKCKVPRRRTASRGTPEVAATPKAPKGVPKKRREWMSTPPEDIYESPLKAMFESPDIKFKVAMSKKDSEINKLFSKLHEEEDKVCQLIQEKQELNKDLKKRIKDLDDLKEEYKKLQEHTKEMTEEMAKYEKEVSEYKKEIKKLKEDIQSLTVKQECLDEDSERLLHANSEHEDKKFKEEFKKIEESFQTEMENLKMVHNKLMEDKDLEIKQITDDLAKTQEVLTELRKENGELQKKLQPLVDKGTADNSNSLIPEVMGNIIYNDERTVVEKLNDMVETQNNLDHKLREEIEERKKFEHLYKSAGEKLKEMNVQFSKQELQCLNLQNEIQKLKQQMGLRNEHEPFSSNASNSEERHNVINELESTSQTLQSVFDFSSPTTEKPMETDRQTRSRTHANKLSTGSRGSHGDTEPEVLLKKAILEFIEKFKNKCDCNELLSKLVNNIQMSDSPAKSVNLLYEFLNVSMRKAADTTSDSPNKLDSSNKRSSKVIDSDTKNKKSNKGENDCHIDCQKSLKDLQKEYSTVLKKYHEGEFSLAETNKKLKEQQDLLAEMKSKYAYAKKYLFAINKDNEKLVNKLKRKDLEEAAKQKECETCKDLQEKLWEVKQDKINYERDTSELKTIVTDLRKKVNFLQNLYENAMEEQKKLEFKMQRETAFLRGSLSERNSIIDHYFAQGRAESRRLAKSQSKAAEENKAEQNVLNINTYILQSEKNESPEDNSLAMANKSIMSSCFQADDEEDFLNHSSLAQIQREVFYEADQNGGRLEELRRRNTLCLPHLQSSYPLEMQDMTPSEAKYYAGKACGQTLSDSKADHYQKPGTSFLGKECNESQKNHFSLKKRKVSEMDESSSTKNSTKKFLRPSSRSKFMEKMKTLTPIRKSGGISKTKTFKTPPSVRSLMQKKKWRR